MSHGQAQFVVNYPIHCVADFLMRWRSLPGLSGLSSCYSPLVNRTPLSYYEIHSTWTLSGTLISLKDTLVVAGI